MKFYLAALLLITAYAASASSAERSYKIADDASSVTDSYGEEFSVLEISNPNERLPHFNGNKARTGISAQLGNCSLLISIPVGRANSNESYGAFCESTSDGNTHGVMICDDNFVGHFALVTTTDAKNPPVSLRSKKQLVDFTFTHCFGG